MSKKDRNHIDNLFQKLTQDICKLSSEVSDYKSSTINIYRKNDIIKDKIIEDYKTKQDYNTGLISKLKADKKQLSSSIGGYKANYNKVIKMLVEKDNEIALLKEENYKFKETLAAIQRESNKPKKIIRVRSTMPQKQTIGIKPNLISGQTKKHLRKISEIRNDNQEINS